MWLNFRAKVRLFLSIGLISFATLGASGCGVRFKALEGSSLVGQAILGDEVVVPGVALVGLEMWFDASDASSLFTNSACTTPASAAANEPVRCWKDKSGNARNAVANANSRRPIARSAVLDGLDALQFDGVNDYFPIGNIRAALGGAYLMIIHQRRAGSAGVGGSWQRLYSSFDPATPGIDNDTWAPGFCVLPSNMGTTNAYLPEIHEIALPSGTNLLNVSIGMNSFWGSDYFAGDVAEIILYNRKISAAERAALLAYARLKYPSATLTPPNAFGAWVP